MTHHSAHAPTEIPNAQTASTFPTPRLMIAPMEGVVDSVMRELLTEIGGVDLCVTEFIRVTDRLLPDSQFLKDCPEMQTGFRTPSGTPVFVQLLGGKPLPLAENAKRLSELGAPGIDLNFGCPAKTVNRHDGGATLLKNPERVFDVVHHVRKAVPPHIPVTAKVRLGFSDKEKFLDIALAAESAGAHWLTVHARTRDEGYRPPAHWDYIAKIRAALEIPVIANGDIWSKEDYLKCLEITGCESAMIGRGLLARPDLARQCRDNSQALSFKEILHYVLRLNEMSFSYRGEGYAVSRTKQWLVQLRRNFTEAQEFFEKIKRIENNQEMQTALRASLY